MMNRNEIGGPPGFSNGGPPGQLHPYVGTHEVSQSMQHSVGMDETLENRGQSNSQSESQAIGEIVSDVEEFARGWIGRIRRLIHRSSQLIERESLLAGAIARLDQQKAEWNQRTAAKEESLRDQSKRLTEAWLEVEAERRKAIQGARVAATASGKTTAGPVVAGPVGVVPPGARPNASQSNPPVAFATANGVSRGNQVQPDGNQITDAASSEAVCSNPARMGSNDSQPNPGAVLQAPVSQLSANQVAANQVPVPNPITNTPPGVQNVSPVSHFPAAPAITPVGNTPINTGGTGTTEQEEQQDQAFAQAEAATRQKIEEFKRMQRAIRANRSK